ncbi:outer membrane beta-barrel protein [Phenylobacterium sp.]|uniref:outer membrane beta-barrel protein n=1 Tax=Phenylobacterium sp. TaxID=1871053 RepID=UPI0025D92051|nr:outer membrane beta-barrel protein [Phenylobacterium sp.]
MTLNERRRSCWVALAVGAGGVVLCAGSAHAQAGGGMPSAGGAQKPFTVDVIGAILYDSNAARGQDQIAVARDLHKSEVTYSPSVLVTVNRPLGRNLVFLSAAGGYDFHKYNKQLESGRVDVSGGGMARLGPCGLSLTGGYAVRQSDLEDLPLRVTRNRQTTRSVAAQTSCFVGTGLTGFLGVSASDTSNSADFNLVDSDSVSLNGGFGYGNRRLGTVQVIGGYTRSSYGESANPLVRNQPGFNAYNIGLQYSREIGNRLSGNASITYQTVDSSDPLIGSSSNLSGTGALDYRLNSRMGLNLIYSRGAAPSIVEGYDYILDESVGLSARYSLSSRIQSSFGARWAKTDYKGRTQVLLDVPTDERTRALFAQVSMQLGRTATVSLNVNQTKRTSNPDVFDYTAYQVGVTAKKSF